VCVCVCVFEAVCCDKSSKLDPTPGLRCKKHTTTLISKSTSSSNTAVAFVVLFPRSSECRMTRARTRRPLLGYTRTQHFVIVKGRGTRFQRRACGRGSIGAFWAPEWLQHRFALHSSSTGGFLFYFPKLALLSLRVKARRKTPMARPTRSSGSSKAAVGN